MSFQNADYLDRGCSTMLRGSESAKGVCSDADDTAKVLTLLNLLGIQASPDLLIRQFESQDHFFTFSHERNPSVSTNSHVLITLLHMSQDNRYLSQIEKCVQYLCRAVWNSDGLIQDKWVSILLSPGVSKSAKD